MPSIWDAPNSRSAPKDRWWRALYSHWSHKIWPSIGRWWMILVQFVWKTSPIPVITQKRKCYTNESRNTEKIRRNWAYGCFCTNILQAFPLFAMIFHKQAFIDFGIVVTGQVCSNQQVLRVVWQFQFLHFSFGWWCDDATLIGNLNKIKSKSMKISKRNKWQPKWRLLTELNWFFCWTRQ